MGRGHQKTWRIVTVAVTLLAAVRVRADPPDAGVAPGDDAETGVEETDARPADVQQEGTGDSGPAAVDPVQQLRSNDARVRALAARCSSPVPPDLLYDGGLGQLRADGSYILFHAHQHERLRLSQLRVRAVWCSVLRSGILAERPRLRARCFPLADPPQSWRPYVSAVTVAGGGALHRFDTTCSPPSIDRKLEEIEGAIRTAAAQEPAVWSMDRLVREALDATRPEAPRCLRTVYQYLAAVVRIDPGTGQVVPMRIDIVEGRSFTLNPRLHARLERCAHQQIAGVRLEWVPLLPAYGVEIETLEHSVAGPRINAPYYSP